MRHLFRRWRRTREADGAGPPLYLVTPDNSRITRGRHGARVVLSGKWGPCWLTGHDPLARTLRYDRAARRTLYDCAKCCMPVASTMDLRPAPDKQPADNVLVFNFETVED